MTKEPPASFSVLRKWSLSLNVVLGALATLAIVLMVNYLGARHFHRFTWSAAAQSELSPLTRRVLAGVTNDVRVTIYFVKEHPLYDPVWNLLKEYKFANDRIQVESVDYERDPGGANLVKARYDLKHLTDKNMVIFECNGRPKFVYENELSELDIQPLVSGKSREVKRTHFKGELMFTSALRSVTSLRPLKAYFLQDHGEHDPSGTEDIKGYAKFAALLKENNILWAPLSLAGKKEMPADCSLLIVAGPTAPLSPEELRAIEDYLKKGGRLLALFSIDAWERRLGLEQVLGDWGVEVGHNVVQDLPRSNNRQDIVTSGLGDHAIVRPLIRSPIHVIMPRTVRKAPRAPAGADAPDVSELFYTSPAASIMTESVRGVHRENPATDVRTNACLAVAVEKGRIRDVAAERGTTRIVVVGDSILFGNRQIDSLGNRDFATLAINWLLARDELLAGLGPKPIKEYRLVMTRSQMSSARWLLLAGLPGAVLLLGLLVWVRRRR
jgi:hypothetical protein